MHNHSGVSASLLGPGSVYPFTVVALIVQDFYEDVFEELDKYGEIENLNVCDNLADHLVGNVYVKFKEEESAAAALAGLAGRPYAGESVSCDVFRCPVCTPCRSAARVPARRDTLPLAPFATASL